MATDWIRCVEPKDCAIQAMSQKGTAVFLYHEPNGALIGFGSLGKTYRTVKSVKHEWSIVPHIGISKLFQKQPAECEWHDRYAALLMADLMTRARTHGTSILVLYVHKDNFGARKLYDRLGFKPLGQSNEAGYQKMFVQNCD